MANLKELRSDEAIFFRDQLRHTRNRAIEDAENFDELLYALERLGCFLLGALQDLGTYEAKLSTLAGKSCLARKVPQKWDEYHVPAKKLFDIVRKSRNEALHQGAFARHLTMRAIELAIILEDALMKGSEKVRDYMVDGNQLCDLGRAIKMVWFYRGLVPMAQSPQGLTS